jgi:succinoglycan biosynthesis transport protein ExoP
MRDPFLDLEMEMEAPSRARDEPAWSPTRQPGHDNAVLSLLLLMRRNAGLICACAIGLALAAFLLSTLLPDRYASTASLLFRQSPLVGQLTGFAEEERFNTVEQEGATNVAVVNSRPVAAETARLVGGDNDLESVQAAMTIEARPNTRVVDVTAEGGTPQEAVRLANTYTEAFISQRTRQVRGQIREALDGLDRELQLLPEAAREGVAGRELEQRINTLRVLNAVQSPNVELIQRAELADKPASPRPGRNAVLGLLFGLLLGIGLAALRQQLSIGRFQPAIDMNQR